MRRTVPPGIYVPGRAHGSGSWARPGEKRVLSPPYAMLMPQKMGSCVLTSSGNKYVYCMENMTLSFSPQDPQRYGPSYSLTAPCPSIPVSWPLPPYFPRAVRPQTGSRLTVSLTGTLAPGMCSGDPPASELRRPGHPRERRLGKDLPSLLDVLFQPSSGKSSPGSGSSSPPPGRPLPG